jgi:hypothetical protein
MARNSIQSIKPVSQSIDSGVFRIKRPIITTNGVSTAVDPVVGGHFAELAALLAKGAFGSRTDPDLEKNVTERVSPTLTPKFAPPKTAAPRLPMPARWPRSTRVSTETAAVYGSMSDRTAAVGSTAI